MTSSNVKALTFDVFGTVVDWRGSISREVTDLCESKGISLDADKFADDWRAGYGPSMARVRSGELPWTKIDVLHRMILDELLRKHGVEGLSEEEIDGLNRAWHRLDPWPDSVAGLGRLKSKFVIATLSNGNVALLTNMAKYGGLPWDCILSAELTKHYKPDPEAYRGAADLLGLPTDQVMMVAAHKGDLHAARAVGLRTAFVPRPDEFGPGRNVDAEADPAFDVVASDFLDLAAKLGA